MTEFIMEVAAQVLAVQCFYDSSRAYCMDYLSTKAPEHSLRITREDLALERVINARTDLAEGVPVRELTDAQLEITAIQRKIAQHLLSLDTMVFHGSAVAVDGSAYLFTAKSGTGKSTHTRLWREVLGDRAIMVNDDKPFLRITDEGVLVYGAPWNGKHRLGSNICVPLKAICLLNRGEQNEIREITAGEALPILLQQSNRPQDGRLLPKYMELLDLLSGQVAFYRLRCNMNIEAAMIAYEAMAGK